MLNEEKYIERCVRSVVEQNYQNWSMYISDNFSDDASLSVAKNASSQNHNINFIERKTKVTSDQNWNELAEFALREVKPEFVMWLGADDFLENPEYLGSMSKKCEKDVIVPSFKNCREDGSYYLNHVFRTDCTSESRVMNHSRLARNWANVVAIYGLYKVSTFTELLRGKSSHLTEAPESDWWWSFALHNNFKVSSSQNDFYVKTIKEKPYYVVNQDSQVFLHRLRKKLQSNLNLRLLAQAIFQKDRIDKGNFPSFFYIYFMHVFFMIFNKISNKSFREIKQSKII